MLENVSAGKQPLLNSSLWLTTKEILQMKADARKIAQLKKV